MIQIEARLDELRALGLQRRTRLVSGPQGPRVVLDGRPVLVLCSDNWLGLADHPRVREAAAEAALRWGVGAGGSRLTSGTMTIHRRAEEQLAEFLGRESALVLGSRQAAAASTVAALARHGDVILCDAHSHPALIDGCRLSGAEMFPYDHCDMDHLEWGIEQAQGRAALVVTESLFALDGDLAPLRELTELAQRDGLRIVVDESSAIGAIGPSGRGALADAGLEDQVDAIIGSFGAALGSHGGFVACDREMASYLLCATSELWSATALAPPAVAGALASLRLLCDRPERVRRLSAAAMALRDAVQREGFDTGASCAQIVTCPVGDAGLASAICDAALTAGLLIDCVRPPVVAPALSRLRLTAMATHRADELRDAARRLGAAARSRGHRPGAVERDDTAVASAPRRLSRQAAEAVSGMRFPTTGRTAGAPSRSPRVFDHEAEPSRRAA
ncbi:MAG TPA: pyridoxal phosphate-dependent aminotransferase family protein [Solirubrobacteraceae bacterium]|nr:pyridoxal phosphate-dependent aminotransferase family protein [Solirubrobacteraceae bacterium]